MPRVQTSFKSSALIFRSSLPAISITALLSLMLQAVATVPESAPVLPWGHVNIQNIDATNAPVEPPPPPPPPPDPDLEALRLLEQNIFTNTPITHLPAMDRIIMIENEVKLDEDTLTLRFDTERLKDVMKRTGELIRVGQQQAAIDYLLTALSKFSSDDALYTINHRLGTLYFRQADYVNARDYMEAALNYKPNSYSLASNIAAVALTIGDVDGALEKLKAINIALLTDQGVLFSVYFNYACAYSLRGETETAVQNLMQAAAVSPQSVYASLGDTQLDNIRDDRRVKALASSLQRALDAGKKPEAAVETATATPAESQPTAPTVAPEKKAEEVALQDSPEEEDYLKLEALAMERFERPPFDRALRIELREPGHRREIRNRGLQLGL